MSATATTHTQVYVHRAEKYFGNHTTFLNDTVRNSNLSLKASGLLLRMLTLPKHWIFNLKHLASITASGVRATWSAMKELQEKGYVKKYALRDERGRFIRWVTEVFESPNLDGLTLLPSLQKPRSRGSRSRKQQAIENTEGNNSGSEKVNIESLPKSLPLERVEIDKGFLGIRSVPNLFATFASMMKPLVETLSALKDDFSAAPPLPQQKVNQPKHSTDTQAPIATTDKLRRLSKITGLSVESLRSNIGLQVTLQTHSQNFDGVLDYLEVECKLWREAPGIGFVVKSLREGRKPIKAGGASFKEWMDEAERRGLVSYSMSEGDDILVCFKSGKTGYWSKLKKLSWEQIEA